MTRADRLANAIIAVGGPDKRCPACGTNAYALARLTLEVLDELGDDDVAFAEDNVRSLPRSGVLDEAQALVDGDRQEDYGDPVVCMGNWAEILRILYGWDIDAHKASVAMSLLKHVREAHRPKRDNRVDGPAYMHIADLAYERMVGQ